MKRKDAFGLGVILFCVDFITKWMVYHFLPLISLIPFYPYGGIGVFKNFFGVQFSVVHATNKGAAWGLFHQWPELLLGVRIFFISLLFFYFAFKNKDRKKMLPLALILSGAIGNVTDFFLYGHVIDMLYFVFWGYSYPVFNVADCAIFLGVAGLIMGRYTKKYVKA